MLNLYGAIFLLRKDIGLGGLENGNFPLLYVVKMSLRRWVGGWFKKASKHPYIIYKWPLGNQRGDEQY